MHTCDTPLWLGLRRDTLYGLAAWKCCSLHQGEDTDLELELEDSYQRLMVHGIATFHSLQSATAQGLTSIRHGRSSTNDSCSGSPAISCADIIFALSANPPGGLTAELLDAQWRRMTFGTDADSEVSYVVV